MSTALKSWKIALSLLMAPLASTAALAQHNGGVPAIPDEFLDFNRPSGDRIVFCLNQNSAIVEFDRAVAQAIADSLLVEAEFLALVDIRPPMPLDYRFTLSSNDLFVFLNNDCDALMGYALPQIGAVPEWLTVTRPYYDSRFVLAVPDPGYRRLQDMVSGAIIGSRVGTHADTRWRSYTRNNDTWEREVFSSNLGLLEALDEGTLDGAIIWEPALYLAANEDPDIVGALSDAVPYSLVDLPFDVAPLRLSIALKSGADFLQRLLDDAIEDLVVGGVIADLLDELGLPAGSD